MVTISPTTYNPTMVTISPTTYNPTMVTVSPTTYNPTMVTISPTTYNPTMVTVSPTTYNPTKEPTDTLTIITTMNPTETISIITTTRDSSCDVDKCYYQTVIEETTTTTITNYDNSAASLIHIYYTFEEFHCDNPRLTFQFEKVDVDRASEYITIKVNDTSIVDCGSGTNRCGQMQTCLNNKRLDEHGIINPIHVGQTLKIGIFISEDTNALCETYDHELYTINAELILNCKEIGVDNNAGAAAISEPSTIKTILFDFKHPISIIMWTIILLLFCVLLCTAIFCWKKRKYTIVPKNDDNEMSRNVDSEIEMADARSTDENDQIRSIETAITLLAEQEVEYNNNDDEKCDEIYRVTSCDDTEMDQMLHDIQELNNNNKTNVV
eukprot:203166_1